MTWVKRTELNARIATGTTGGAVGNTTSLPGFIDYIGNSYVDATSKRLVLANGFGGVWIWEVYGMAHKTTNQRIVFNIIYDSTRGIRWNQGFRVTGVGGQNGAFQVYENLEGAINLYGWTSSVSGLASLAASPALNLVDGNEYQFVLEMVGPKTATTFTAGVWDVTNNGATLTPHIFNSGTNAWSWSGAHYHYDADAKGFIGIGPDNSDYTYLATYDDIVGPSPLTVPPPTITNITSNSAHAASGASGGTGTLHHFWEIKIDDAWTDSGLGDHAEVDFTGLVSASDINIRETVTDSTTPTPQSVTNGIIFHTQSAPANLDAYFTWEFGPGGYVAITAHVSGNTGNITHTWAKGETDAGYSIVSGAGTATVVIHSNDVEIFHKLNYTATDAASKTWTYNNSGNPTFVYPLKAYLLHTNTVLRPTATNAVALPTNMSLMMISDSHGQAGNPNVIQVVANTLQAVKGGDAIPVYEFGAYGYSSGQVAQTRSEAAAIANTRSVTDILIWLGYNDQGDTAQASAQTVYGLATGLKADVSTCQRVWIICPPFRSGGPFADGDGAETRLRQYITEVSGLVNGTTINSEGGWIYNLTQSDRSLYDGVELTHGNQLAQNTEGDWIANMILAKFPIAVSAVSPITGIAANATRQFVFPVPGTVSQQVQTYSVARQGGGAAFGGVDSTGKYTAASSLPPGSGNADVLSVASVGGYSASVVLQYAPGSTPGDTTPPTLTFGPLQSDGVTIAVTPSEAMDTDGTTGLTVRVGGVSRPAVLAWQSPTAGTLTLSSAGYTNQTVTISKGSSGDIADVAGNLLAPFSNRSITNGSEQSAPTPEPGTGAPFWFPVSLPLVASALNTIALREGDNGPSRSAQLTDAQSRPYPIPDTATVVYRLRRRGVAGRINPLPDQEPIEGQAVIVAGAFGVVRFDFTDENPLPAAGNYDEEWVVDDSAGATGQRVSFPSDGYVPVIIKAPLI